MATSAEKMQIDAYYTWQENEYLERQSRWPDYWFLNGQVIQLGDEKEYLLKLLNTYGAKQLAEAMDWDLDDFVYSVLDQPADQDLYETMMEQLGAERRG